MALQGSLRDFSIADILQLIALQKKTGLLTLKSPDDTVNLGFSDGALVSAESSAKRIDTRLGTVLVKTRRLSADALSKALEIQGQTLQRLGFILLKNGFCSAEDLRAGLDIQIRKIAYAVFRWTDGDYIFDQQDRIDYDHEFVGPIGVEGLLMEGARMTDEWPVIEKVVRSPELVYRRVPVSQPVEPAGEESSDDPFSETVLSRSIKTTNAIHISAPEWAIYEFVDGRRRVGDIIERTFLSEFEGAKAFYDLVSRGLIEEAPASEFGHLDVNTTGSIEMPRPRASGSKGLAAIVLAVVVLLGILSAAFQARNPANVLTRPVPIGDAYLKSLSLLKLRRMSEAVDAFYLTSGKFPDSKDQLPAAKLLHADDLLDPWGHPYRYILQPEKYYLVGFDREGRTDTDLFISHTVRAATPPANTTTKTKAGKEIIVIN